MGLITVDVFADGVVMCGDSQGIEILGGTHHIETGGGRRTRNPIVVHRGGGFTGLVGSVGTEQIEGTRAAAWLKSFSDGMPGVDHESFCPALAARLTEIWKRDDMKSILEILVTGVVDGDVKFWYVRNRDGLSGFGHSPPAVSFRSENDLDLNYVPPALRHGESKRSLLSRVMFSFWQGVHFPASVVFQGFQDIMGPIYASGVDGFVTISSLDDLGFYARVRMEFLKRLYSPTHGIYAKGQTPPVGGDVHTYGVALDGEVRRYVKNNVLVALAAPAPSA
jgi:hypothetical protein